MTIALIGVPTSAGSHGPGQEKAPQALRRAGLVEGLRAAGLEVEDHGDLPTARYQAHAADPRQRNLDDVVEVAGRVADQVHAVLDRGQRPLVLGGDCTITLGVVAGFARHGDELGLVYLDGDADLSTPATSRSGVLDSMGVAHLLGEGAPALAGIGPRTPLLAPDRLLLFGYDDPDDLGEPQQALLASPKLGGLVVTEVNPDHDPGGQLARLVDGLVAALAHQGPRSPGPPTIRS